MQRRTVNTLLDRRDEEVRDDNHKDLRAGRVAPGEGLLEEGQERVTERCRDTKACV